MDWRWRTLVTFTLCAIFVAAVVVVMNSDANQKTFLSRMFDPESRDPDEPTEQEENARSWGQQFSFSQSSMIPSSSVHDSESGYNVQRMQKILNEIKADSGKYVQIDRQRNAILASIKNLEAKARALTSERDDVKTDISRLTHKQQTIVDHLEGVDTIGHRYWYVRPNGEAAPPPATNSEEVSASATETAQNPSSVEAQAANPAAPLPEQSSANAGGPAPEETSNGAGPTQIPPQADVSSKPVEQAPSVPSTEPEPGRDNEEAPPTIAEPSAESPPAAEPPAAGSEQAEPDQSAVYDPYAAPPPAADAESNPAANPEGSPQEAVYDPYAVPAPPVEGEPAPPQTDETTETEASEGGSPPTAEQQPAARRRLVGHREARRPVRWAPEEVIRARERSLPVARVVSVSQGPGFQP